MELTYTPFDWNNWKKKPYHPSVDEIEGLGFELAEGIPTYKQVPFLRNATLPYNLLKRANKTPFLPVREGGEKRPKKIRVRRISKRTLFYIRRRSRDESGEILKYPKDPISKNNNYGKKS